MNILITGSDSQISKSLKKIHFYDKCNIFYYNKNKLDITNQINLRKVFKKIKPNILINCAAYTNVKKAEIDQKKTNLVNNLALEFLSKACNDYNTTLIHFSTDYVFNGKKKKKYIENDKTYPKSIYGKTKLEGEKKIKLYCKSYLIFRVSWLFSEYSNNFVIFIINKLKKNEDIFVVKDLYGIPTSATDLSNFLKCIIQNEKKLKLNNIYHFVNNGKCISWLEFAKEIQKLYSYYFKSESKIIPVSAKDLFKDNIRPVFSALDNNKVRKTSKFKIANWKNTLNETIERIIKSK